MVPGAGTMAQAPGTPYMGYMGSWEGPGSPYGLGGLRRAPEGLPVGLYIGLYGPGLGWEWPIWAMGPMAHMGWEGSGGAQKALVR